MSKLRSAAFTVVVSSLMGLSAQPVWAQTADSILSKHVKEADGTTGQDTNNGSGIKTGHIQNGAVTGAKLASGAISGSAIAAGAVTDDKIAGPISRSKLQMLGGVAVVARSGGDYLTPQAAMAALATWCGTPTATNPCVIMVMPGTYQLGSQPLIMQPFVDIAGSGRGVTVLSGNVDGPLIIGSSSELRDLTAQNTASGANVGVGVRNVASLRRASVIVTSSVTMNIGVEATVGTSVLEDVSVQVSGSYSGEAIKGGGGSLVLRNVQASATGTGGGEVTAFFALGADHWLTNVELNATAPSGTPIAMIVSWNGPSLAQVHARAVTATAVGADGASIGAHVVRGNLWLDGSYVYGTTSSVAAGWAFAGAASVTSTRLEGGPVTRYTADSTAVCSGVTDENYVFYANQCP